MPVQMLFHFTHLGTDYEAELSVYPSTPDVFYLKNGDPGYPGDPAEIEITNLWKLVGKDKLHINDPKVIEQAAEFLYDSYYTEIDSIATDSRYYPEPEYDSTDDNIL